MATSMVIGLPRKTLLRDKLPTLDAIEQAVAIARQTFLLFISVAEETAA